MGTPHDHHPQRHSGFHLLHPRRHQAKLQDPDFPLVLVHVSPVRHVCAATASGQCVCPAGRQPFPKGQASRHQSTDGCCVDTTVHARIGGKRVLCSECHPELDGGNRLGQHC